MRVVVPDNIWQGSQRRRASVLAVYSFIERARSSATLQSNEYKPAVPHR